MANFRKKFYYIGHANWRATKLLARKRNKLEWKKMF